MNDPSPPRSRARPSHPEGRDPGLPDERDPAERIVAGLSVLGSVLRAEAWRRATDQDLNPTQARILSLLVRGDSAGVTLQYLARRLGVSGPTASDSVSALEDKGLVRKTPSPSDRRALAIRLTRSGRDAARALAEGPADLLAAVRRLSDGDEAGLLRILVTILRELEAEGLAAPNRLCVTCRFFDPLPDGPPATRPYYCRFARAFFGDANLRVDCQDHEPAEEETATDNWAAFQTVSD